MLTDAFSTGSRLPEFAAASHLGHSRTRNEDFYCVVPDKGLAVVADGVGGQGDGAWASRRAVELFVENLDTLGPCSGQNQAVHDALQFVHAQMVEETRHRDGGPGGTTIAGIWAAPQAVGSVTIFNVGDSPIFRCSNGGIEKVSHDHSLYQLWLDSGRVGREPGKRTIMQALGISSQLSPHIASFAAAPRDIVLMCTDGLSSAVSAEHMKDVLTNSEGSQHACETLMRIALSGPAKDNVTVSVCTF